MDKKNSEFTRIKNKHTQNFRTLFPTRPIERNYKANLNSLLEQLQKTQSDFTKQLNDKQYESKSLTQQRKNLNDQMKLKEKELRDSEEQIYEQCQGQEYLDVVAKLKEKSEKLEMDCGILRSSKLMYKRYVSKMTEDPCCPLCHKDMDHSEVGDLTSEIQEKIRSMPRDLENAETLLKNERIKYEKLLSLRFAYENLSKLKEDIVKIKVLIDFLFLFKFNYF